MQRELVAELVISMPEGKTTLVLSMVTSLWQAAQVTVVPMGKFSALITPASVPSAPRKSR